MRNTFNVKNRGVSAIEVVIGVSLASLILLFTSHTIARFVNVGRDTSDKTQALYLAEDAIELVRYLRDEDWTTIDGLSSGNQYYLSVTGATPSLGASIETIDTYFSRWFEVEPVYRNGNDDVVLSTDSGAVADDDSKYVTAYVSWGTPVNTVELTTIVADIHD